MILMKTNYTPGMKFVRVAWQLCNNYFIYLKVCKGSMHTFSFNIKSSVSSAWSVREKKNDYKKKIWG